MSTTAGKTTATTATAAPPLAQPAEPWPNHDWLLEAVRRMFEPAELARLAGRRWTEAAASPLNGQAAELDPTAATEAIALDFLAKGGKHSRPFITLAVYDALADEQASGASHSERTELPVAVRRTALSIEAFHKASLVHDDIEDDDPFRYGEPTLHRKYGVPVAINVGDYLIGLGYRLVSRESAALGADVVSDILDQLAGAHLRLSEGQGAELLWRDARRQQLTPAEALKIYSLKTAPAFEAALLAGLRLAGPIEQYLEPIGRLAHHLGVAFQIGNDLDDWQTDNHNKLVAAGDVLGGRPTVLWALACEGLAAADRGQLEALVNRRPATEATIEQIRRLYQSAGVFDKAEGLVQEYEEEARRAADSVAPPRFRRLLRYLIDIVLRARRPAIAAAR